MRAGTNEEGKLEMCPRPGPFSPTHRQFEKKNEVEKRAITLIIIGRFYPKSNLTLYSMIVSMYKI